jgi:hypothetical protein
MGFELEIGFIDHLQLITTSNCNTIADLHTLQITTAHAKSSQSAFTSHFPVTDLNRGGSSATVLMSLLISKYPITALLLQLTNSPGWRPSHTILLVFNSHTDLQLTSKLFGTDCIENTVSSSSSIVAHGLVCLGTCLFHGCYPVTGIHATVTS